MHRVIQDRTPVDQPGTGSRKKFTEWMYSNGRTTRHSCSLTHRLIPSRQAWNTPTSTCGQKCAIVAAGLSRVSSSIPSTSILMTLTGYQLRVRLQERRKPARQKSQQKYGTIPGVGPHILHGKVSPRVAPAKVQFRRLEELSQQAMEPHQFE